MHWVLKQKNQLNVKMKKKAQEKDQKSLQTTYV